MELLGGSLSQVWGEAGSPRNPAVVTDAYRNFLCPLSVLKLSKLLSRWICDPTLSWLTCDPLERQVRGLVCMGGYRPSWNCTGIAFLWTREPGRPADIQLQHFCPLSVGPHSFPLPARSFRCSSVLSICRSVGLDEVIVNIFKRCNIYASCFT